MRRFLIYGLSILAVVGLVSANAWSQSTSILDSGDELNAVQNELSRLQGSWEFVNKSEAGKKVLCYPSGCWKLTINGREFRLESKYQLKKGTIKIAPLATPRRLDFVASEITASHCIYEINQDKRSVGSRVYLRICFPAGEDFPDNRFDDVKSPRLSMCVGEGADFSNNRPTNFSATSTVFFFQRE